MAKKKKHLKRIIKKILRQITFEPAPLNDRKGPLIDDYRSKRFTSRKDKKRREHVTARIIHPGVKWSEIIEEGLEPPIMQDDWRGRDGYRAYYKDATRFKDENKYFLSSTKKHYLPKNVNRKIRKQIAIRKARKE